MAIDRKAGLFTNVGTAGVESDPLTYKMTPKYRDPYEKSDTERKLAKFLISSKLKTQIEATLKEQNDPILALLGTGGAEGSRDGRGYFDFFLNSIDESFEEKFQITETLGDSYAIFGLGKKPRIISCSGYLLNTEENEWRVNFIRMFEKYISISSLAKFRTKGINNLLTMVYDSLTVRGAILSLRTGIRADNELATAFSFQMIVTQSDVFNLKELKTRIAVTSKKKVVVSVSEESKSTDKIDDIKNVSQTVKDSTTLVGPSFDETSSAKIDEVLATIPLQNNRG